MKPIISENFTDNGAHSHWSVINADTGEIIIKNIINFSKQCPLYVDCKKSYTELKERKKNIG